MLADQLLGFFSTDLAIDLGTANTLVFVRDKGIVLNEPSIIAVRRADRAVIGVGREAKAMLGRTPDNILAIHEPGGHLVVDIGGGTTEVAVISMSGTVYCNSVRIAGDEMDEAIIQHIRKHYRLLIGERRSEEIKIALGSAHPLPGEHRTIEVKGRDLVDGVPKTIVVTDEEIREALREPVMTIVETVRTCLERTPPELAGQQVVLGDRRIVPARGEVLVEGGVEAAGVLAVDEHVFRQDADIERRMVVPHPGVVAEDR